MIKRIINTQKDIVSYATLIGKGSLGKIHIVVNENNQCEKYVMDIYINMKTGEIMFSEMSNNPIPYPERRELFGDRALNVIFSSSFSCYNKRSYIDQIVKSIYMCLFDGCDDTIYTRKDLDFSSIQFIDSMATLLHGAIKIYATDPDDLDDDTEVCLKDLMERYVPNTED